MYSSVKVRQGGALKAKALAMAMKRKEEYLGARVPRELKQKVIRRAEELDIPVSILIRKVLEDAFGDQQGSFIKQEPRGEDRSKGHSGNNKFPMVLGWEVIRLNRSASCTGCGQQLEAGKQIIMGVSPAEEERILLCDVCKGSL